MEPVVPATSWTSYDSVAGIYEDVAVPWFTPMARDLVSWVAPRPGARVLDVGTGTGLVHRVLMAMTVPQLVVGVDPSAAMLTRARAAPGARIVAAKAPGLPFSPEVFDVVVANLVVSHLPDLNDGLADMARVLRHGGRLGGTAWALAEDQGEENQRAEADEVVDAVVRACRIDSKPPVRVAPWEEQLREPGCIEASFRRAGLEQVTVRMRTYRWTFTIEDFLAGWGSQARYMRHVAGEDRWDEFCDRAAAALHRRFGATIRSVSHTWIAIGTKP
jgi:ubiquinone/menaquinone biosynthesis C-methylase UbiE